ncbi:hypothetical protein LQF12_04940 [Ruania suaedae]|uniref:hypothetical protein n=1 Tax=Ruania suaedae TaxID=2897774 RepID=UPI001E5AB2A1|nr:hypothetical protein [Ruania suaedae]UFU03951.1 hypothetical protein LQF12_04940 [Ruania suaedae]
MNAVEMKNLICTPAIGVRISGTRAFTMARLRAVAGPIGGAATAAGGTSTGVPAPGSAPDLT